MCSQHTTDEKGKDSKSKEAGGSGSGTNKPLCSAGLTFGADRPFLAALAAREEAVAQGKLTVCLSVCVWVDLSVEGLVGWLGARDKPLHFTSLHFTSLHFTSLHFTSLHFTSLHFVVCGVVCGVWLCAVHHFHSSQKQ
jgi:hypothetical protein